jgi:hypothetical protein
MTNPRQPAYDAVFDTIRAIPARAGDGYGVAVENARVWRAVEAALTAMGIPKGAPPDGVKMASEQARVGSNSGHGHAWPRPDGAKARCGGPGLCVECSYDQQLAVEVREDRR